MGGVGRLFLLSMRRSADCVEVVLGVDLQVNIGRTVSLYIVSHDF